MNLNPSHASNSKDRIPVSIPIRDLMNLNPFKCGNKPPR